MKRMKKVAVLFMALTMCFAVAGCKKETGEEVPTGDIYSPKFSEVNADIDYVSSVMSKGNKLYILGQKYDNEDYTYTQKLLTIDAATGEQTAKEIDLAKDSDKNEEVSLQSLSRYQDGFMGVIYRYIQPTQEEMDSGSYDLNTNYTVEVYDEDLNVLTTISLDELQKSITSDGGYFYIQNIAADGNGNIYITNSNTLYVVDGNGDIKCQIEFENWINGLFTADDGQVYALYYNENYDSVIAPIDLTTKSLGTELENIPANNYGSLQVYPAGDGKIYVAGTNKLYLYDIATQTSEEILDWVSCDISANRISGFAVLEDGSFVAVSTTSDYSGDVVKTTIELASISKVPASSVKQKKTVTLAMMYLDYDIQESVIKFNRNNDEYRVNIKTYVNDDYSNYEDAQTQFQADIAAGTAGDFFMADGNINVDNLIAKGALADLSASSTPSLSTIIAFTLLSISDIIVTFKMFII